MNLLEIYNINTLLVRVINDEIRLDKFPACSFDPKQKQSIIIKINSKRLKSIKKNFDLSMITLKVLKKLFLIYTEAP